MEIKCFRSRQLGLRFKFQEKKGNNQNEKSNKSFYKCDAYKYFFPVNGTRKLGSFQVSERLSATSRAACVINFINDYLSTSFSKFVPETHQTFIA